MFFDELNLWSLITNNEVIHFAPEKNLSPKIEEYSPSKYVKGDLYPANDTIQKIDLTNIPYEDETFGLFLCNHVLEHVPDYKKAMQEIFRVLRPGGTAILQTPYSKLLKNNFEDEGINTDELRLIFYGQEDHARYFSETQFLQSLMECGFELQIVKHSDLFDADKATYYGVNKNEDLIRVLKPSTK
ncbi:methyltransferase domain-containing protein [Aquimarina sp. MMG016]|nr:methyltransferase domain-containing protein [Aquimarina sp. MMG016]MBQ4819232.1 methyltransferase domain-containing protein [Aquimarina sp. MMG016]